MWRSLLLCVVLAFPVEAKVTRYFTGNPADVSPPLSGPLVMVEGGGSDVDSAMQAMFDEVRGCSGCAATLDVVVLRATGADGYNPYLAAMEGVDSVETLVITKRADASLPEVEAAVRHAEVVFFAGGDQCDYVTLFKDTPVEAAVEAVYARGGAVGGVSAGLAIQGQFVFDACRKSVTSDQMLSDPYDRGATFTRDFFAWNDFQGVMTDSHFAARDRMGRLMSFLARQLQDGFATTALGMGVDEGGAVLVGANGVATVYGTGSAWFVLADHPPLVCAPKQPLSYADYRIWRVTPGGSFNLRSRPTTGWTTSVSVSAGVLSGDPY